MAEQPSLPLAKYLASTDKNTRDKAVKNLAQFLSDPSHDELPPAEMTKLWKGLFYCFWMSDKPLVQQALANELADLLLMISSTSSSLAFLRGFWEAMGREWNGIDRLRMDKYYMLIRRFVNASFRLLIRCHWDSVQEYNQILTGQGGPLSVGDSRVPLSLTYHLCDIYLEELDKALKDSEQPAPFVPLMDPFCSLAARTNSSVTYDRVAEAVLQPLLSALSANPPELSGIRQELGLDQSYRQIQARANNDEHVRQSLLDHLLQVASGLDTRTANGKKLHAIWRAAMADDPVPDDPASVPLDAR